MRTKILLGCASLLLSLSLANLAAAQCEGIGWQYAEHFLTVHHDTVYNCAVYSFSHEVELQDATLIVREHAVTSGWADCMCPYFTEVVIGGLSAGTYTLRFEYGENETDEPPAWWTWCELPVVIPETPREQPDVLMVDSSASGCGILTDVPDEEVPAPLTWSALKAFYH